MSTSEQVKQSEVKQEQGEASPTPTKTVTKQKDPKRVAMRRQLGLKSKEYKLKKQEMMKSEKQVVNREDESYSSSGNPSSLVVMGAGGVVLVLGLGYFVYTKFKSSLHLPTLTPAIIEQKDSFEQETRRDTETLSPTPSKIPKLTGVVDME